MLWAMWLRMKTAKNEIKTEIRDYRPEDYTSLLYLWKKTGLSPPERKDCPEDIERCNKQGGRLLVMENTGNGMIIGSSWMTSDGRRIYIHHFGILPSMQGRGLGTELARGSIEWIRKQGLQVKLEVHKENHKAKHLYEKFGFFAFTDYDIYMKRDFE